MDKVNHLAEELKRRRLEDLQKRSGLGNTLQLSDSEIQHLINELQVHQVELEMQNEELIRAKELADLATEKYTELYDFAPSGYFTLSNDCTIVELNLSGAQLLGKNRSQLINTRFDSYISGDAIPEFHLFISEVFDNRGKVYCEAALSVNDQRPVYLQLTAICNPNGNLCMLTAVDVTDRKIGENELNSSRLLMKGAIESQKDTILLAIDHDYRYLYFNETHFESMKNAYHSKVELGRNILDYISSEEDRKVAKVNYDRALSGESHSNVRRFGDKMYAWYESFFNPILNEKNEVIGATALARNINEKVEADEALKKSNELHKAILLSALDGFCLLDTNGQILEVNEAYCRMSGYSEQELLTRSVHDLEFMEASESTDSHLKKIIEQGHDIFESRHKAKDGSHFDVEVSVQYRPFENGRIVVFLHDITNRKRTEKMLRERETRLNQTQEMAHLGSWELDLKTDRLIWSDEVYRIFGLVPQEFAITHDAFMEFVHPDDREALNLAYFNSITDGKEGYEIEHRIIRWKTNEIRYLNEKCYHVRDASGTISRSVGMVQDITSLRETSEALRRSEALLRTTQRLTSVGGWEWNIAKKTMFWTEELYRIHDFNPSDFEPGSAEHNKRSLECYTPHDRNTVIEAYQRCLKNREPDGFELPFTTALGRRLWIKNLIEPVIENGQVVRVSGIVIDITEQRRSENLLRENEEIFKCFLEHSPVYVFFKDHNINALRLSRNYEALLGKPMDALLGKNMNDLFPSMLAEAMIADDQRILREGKVIQVEEEFNGRFYSTIKFPVVTEGKPNYLAGYTLDITEQKMAEQALKQSEERLNLILRGSNDAPWDLNLENNNYYYSPQWWAMLGYEVDELPVNAGLWESLLYPGDQQTMREILGYISDNNTHAFEVEIHMQHKKGHYISILARAFILRDASGKAIRVSGTNTDLTIRKNAEKDLIESRELYRDLVELAVDGVLVGSGDGLIIDANSCLCTMLGIKKEDLIGTYFGKLIFTRESLKHSPARLTQIKKGEVVISERNILRPGGNEITIEIRTKMMPNGTYQSIFRDITNRKRIEAEIKSKNTELQQINAEKDKYFSIIAHDLRNPLSGFIGLTEMMAKGLHRMTLDEIHDLAKMMSKSANNLFRLLSNLLEWSSIQQGLIKFVPTSFLLMPEITESLRPVIDRAEAKNIAISFDIPEHLKVFSDRNMLHVIMRNLFANGVKFTPVGGKVSVSARTLPGNIVEIAVADTGIGMSRKMIHHLFRLDINTNRKGTEGELSTGLGLIICKDFIGMHGGKLVIESDEGQGSTFRFTVSAIPSDVWINH